MLQHFLGRRERPNAHRAALASGTLRGTWDMVPSARESLSAAAATIEFMIALIDHRLFVVDVLSQIKIHLFQQAFLHFVREKLLPARNAESRNSPVGF